MKNSIIGRTLFLALGLAVAFAIIVFSVLSLSIPGVMAGLCEKTGNYSFALTYASLHYTYTGEAKEAARCAQDSILTGNDKKIIKYGIQFIDHEDFDAYCAQKDEYYQTAYGIEYSYRQYIYGEVACAYYSQGDAQSAIGCAIQAMDSGFDRSSYSSDGDAGYTINGFSDDNALITLSLKVIEKYDEGAAQLIAVVLDNVTAEGEEAENLAEFTAIITWVAQGTYPATR